jgi:hypothetical protein
MSFRCLHYHRDGTPCENVLEWARDFGEDRRVKQETLQNGYFVSTVFLGLDHNFSGGPPLIFETMVFAPSGEELDIERYSTEESAKAGHEEMVRRWREKGSDR